MAGLTKQDIQILMEGVQKWETPDITKISVEGLGCPCARCNPDPAAWIEKAMSQLRRRFMEERESRQERSILLRSKLIALRDSIVADELFDSVDQNGTSNN